MKNELMIFCTCCEYNKEYYIKRVYNWYKQILNNISLMRYYPDLYVFVDGNISNEDIIKINPELLKLNWINLTPMLGRKDIWRFPGWKRSFNTALNYGLNYNYLVHIESDILLLKPEKIISKFTDTGYFCGWCKTHKFIESSLMILNDKNNNKKLIERYSNINNLNESIDFERTLMHLFKWNIIFNGDRIEGQQQRYKKDYDFIAQIYG